MFCPRYRRKIFLIPNVERRFKELVKMKCKELEIEIQEVVSTAGNVCSETIKKYVENQKKRY